MASDVLGEGRQLKPGFLADGIDLGPTQVGAIEFADNGAILQGFNCVRQGTTSGASVICSGVSPAQRSRREWC